MGKKNKIKDAVDVTENVANAEQLDSANAPPVKRKGKKQSSADTDSAATTNGSVINAIKKDKKKKSKELKAVNSDEGEKETKIKKKKQLKNATAEEDEQLISFKKSNKKRPVEPETPDEEIPAKVSKADGNLITAGTTIDQVVGIKLKNKKGKREKGRDKHAVQVEEQKKKAKEKEREEIHQYLDCWRANREKWKFLKLRQIYIQDHVFDEDEINADLWPTALDYLSGTKGASKDILVKKAESIIRDGDAAAAGEGDETLQASCKYERARELLQCLG
ncbi:uncharacterized protein C7orf50 homolog [Anopheles marshallii]|uniref:uncharacterized protein C7orf50 homolog n=1 Tax=Anopheles marshallii TaxID=1521116 RepID=UPI00237BFEE5|nr:uncharacterized protein C7orf50 homolog [Anopheles marshallii]